MILDSVMRAWSPIADAICGFRASMGKGIPVQSLHKQILNGTGPSILYGHCDFAAQYLPICTNKVKYCFKTTPFSYYCYTCMSFASTNVCEDCFDKNLHKDHHYKKCKQADNFICKCGLGNEFSGEYLCKGHGQDNGMQPSNEDIMFYQRLLEHLFHLKQLAMQNLPYNYVLQLGNKMVKVLLKFTSCSPLYIDLTVKHLVSSKGSDGQLLLHSLISNPMMQLPSWLPLFWTLSNSEWFVQQFFTILSSTVSSFKSLNQKHNLYSYFKTFQNSPELLNSLASKDILMFANSPKSPDMYGLYSEAYNINKETVKSQRGILTDVWRCMLKKQLIDFPTMKRTHYLPILLDSASQAHPDLFFQIIEKFLLDFIAVKKQNPYFFFSAPMETLFDCLLKYNNCKEDELAPTLFCLKLSKTDIEFIGEAYLSEVITVKHFSRLNYFVVNGIRQLFNLYELDFQKKCEHYWEIEADKLNQLTVSKISQNILTKFVNSDKRIQHKMKLLNRSEQQAVQEYEAQLEAKFRRYLSTKRQISLGQIKELLSKGALDFPNIKQIMKHEMDYEEDCSSFIYTGEEVPSLDTAQERIQQLDKIVFMQQDEFLNCPQEKQCIFPVLVGLYRKPFDEESFSKVPTAEINKICSRAVVLDKIVQGEDPGLRKFLIDLKNYWQKHQPNEQIDRLLGIKRYPQVMQQIAVILAENPTQEEEKPQNIGKPFQEQPLIQENKQSLKMQSNEERLVQIKQETAREKKLRAMKQKIKQKAQTHLDKHGEKAKQEEQICCIVCKDSQNVKENQLYFCGKLSKDRFCSVFQRENKLIGDYSIISCFHPLHYNCSNQLKIPKCPFCKLTVTIFLPIINEDMTKDPNKVRMILEQLSEQSSKSEQIPIKPPDLIVLLFKIIINRSVISELWLNKTEQGVNNEIYCMNLLKILSAVLTNAQKLAIEKLVKKQIKHSEEGEKRTALNDIEIVFIQFFYDQYILNGLRKETLTHSSEVLQKIRHKEDLNVVGGMLLKAYRLLGKEIDFEVPSQINSFDKWEAFVNRIDMPENAAQLLAIRRQCSQCFLLKQTYCLLCEDVICSQCQRDKHSNIHKSTYLIINIVRGSIEELDKKVLLKSYRLYKNVFQMAFESEARDPAEYKFDKKAYMSALTHYLKAH